MKWRRERFALLLCHPLIADIEVGCKKDAYHENRHQNAPEVQHRDKAAQDANQPGGQLPSRWVLSHPCELATVHGVRMPIQKLRRTLPMELPRKMNRTLSASIDHCCDVHAGAQHQGGGRKLDNAQEEDNAEKKKFSYAQVCHGILAPFQARAGSGQDTN